MSLDLIGGLPHQTRATWQASLQTAAGLGVHHVSVHDLQVEQRTAFGKWYEPGVHPLPEEAEAANMYRDASRILGGSGFEHYEVSNYARGSQHKSAHNLAYWRNEAFLGFGLGATSHLASVRLARPRKMAEYASFVDELEDKGFESAQKTHGLLEEGRDAMTTRLMLALRTREGVAQNELAKAFAARGRVPRCGGGAASEWIAKRPTEGDHDGLFALTDPDGLLFSNEAISRLRATG